MAVLRTARMSLGAGRGEPPRETEAQASVGAGDVASLPVRSGTGHPGRCGA